MKLKISVEQVINGREYQGTIEGLSEDLNYKLKFGVPIDQLDDQKIPESKEEAGILAKKLFNFTVKKGEDSLEMSDELFAFMVQTAGHVTLIFYNDEQAKSYNNGSGVLSHALNSKENSLMGAFGASVSIGMSSSIDLPKEKLPTILQN
jgi:hypothetical protein